ncbi:helix-turn-helix domain-containing protein [Streptomyces sp. NPDC059788]|uniref:helix-turn-helix domain-containing protein n=1 Tax=Streptomyces sp. NPDC059788 TaxID=3346948 RepID=UPI00364A1050
MDCARRHHEENNHLVEIGYPISEIARRLGIDRKTVRRYRDTGFDVPLACARDRRNVLLDEFKPSLHAACARGVAARPSRRRLPPPARAPSAGGSCARASHG